MADDPENVDVKALAAAPYCKSIGKINLPAGRKPVTRERIQTVPRPGDLTTAEVKERKAKAISAKQTALLDYYATVDVPAERVAQHVGLYRLVEVGIDEASRKPIYERQLDVAKAERELVGRRK